jgi:phosphatidylglycerol lysyltransferase
VRFRDLLLLGLLTAFLWFISSNLDQFQLLVNALSKGRWQWLLAALALQVVFFSFYARLYQSAFDVVGVRAPYRDLFALSYAAIFVNSTTPSGGAAGAVLFVDDLRRRGQPVSRAATGSLLVLAADYAAFCIILLAGLIALFRFQTLHSYEIVAAAIMLGSTAAMLLSIIVGLRRPLWLYHFFGGLERFINRIGGWFRQPALLTEDWGERSAGEFVEVAQSMTRHHLKVVRTGLLAIVTHAINVLMLYCCFWAFDQPVTFGVLIAGYAMTILFWIVSPTPNGIGVVEGLMPVIYASLGLPVAESTVVSFAFRGFSFWIPLLIGFVLLRRAKLFDRTERSLAEAGDVRLIAVLTTIMGIVNLISGSTPALADRLQWLGYLAPLSVSHGGHLTAVLLGFALMLLAQRLWQRKRTAWIVTVLVLALSVVVHLVKGLDFEEAILAAVLAGFLLSQRSRFYALSDPPSLLRSTWLLLAALFFTFAYGAVGFYLLERHFATPYTLDSGLQQTLLLFTAWQSTGVQPRTEFGNFFVFSIYIVGVVTVGYALVTLLQVILSPVPVRHAQQRRAQQIVERYAQTPMARLTLLPDKRYYFSPGGSCVAYAVHGHMAVTLGDPIGPPEDIYETILGLGKLAQKRRWQIAFTLTGPDYLELYRRANFQTVVLAYEGILDLKTPQRIGRQNEQVRLACEQMSRLGYSTRLYKPPLSDRLLQELRTVSEEWLVLTQRQEWRFLFGWFDDDYVRQQPVFTVQARDRSIAAFASLLPGYQRSEIACDLVRWRVHINPGLFEMLYADLIDWVQGHGYERFNLGLTVLPSGSDALEEAPITESARYLANLIHELYRFRGDYSLKQRFQPMWAPRYLVYPTVEALPAIALTLQRAILHNDIVVNTVTDLVGQMRRRHRT